MSIKDVAASFYFRAIHKEKRLDLELDVPVQWL